ARRRRWGCMALSCPFLAPPDAADRRNVLLLADDQLAAARGMVALDGRAARLLVAPPDIDGAHLREVAARAGIDLVATGRDGDAKAAALGLPTISYSEGDAPAASPLAGVATEWLLLTSGTSGAPKVVGHRLDALTGSFRGAPSPVGDPSPVWGTFYDIRRYGGLQIFLRAACGGSLVLGEKGEPIADHLARLVGDGASHVSGTPSHWRKATMSASVEGWTPAYVRLSGEIADQAVLDRLRAVFPGAKIEHAFASTEAGVGFAVGDGRAGFPAAWLETPPAGVEIKLVDGALALRSARAASRYVGDGAAPLADSDGFVSNGDLVEVRGDRCTFVGRLGGIINVGGLKVHPEEVEAAINSVPGVRMSRARGRPSPVTGAIVVADVVLDGEAGPDAQSRARASILERCRATLAPHKTPALVSFVGAIETTAAGKVARRA
ncbi:MAG: acyl--CoA ligase, partial [Hyphomicrobiales bacterium]|nr:acyl--CoA ligase [Hyphomicrobiales bacterium]